MNEKLNFQHDSIVGIKKKDYNVSSHWLPYEYKYT